MTQRVHKWTLAIDDEQSLKMKFGATILSVEVQHHAIVLYAIENIELEQYESVTIFMHGTGHDVRPQAHRFIGTVKVRGGELMFHVFEGPRHG